MNFKVYAPNIHLFAYSLKDATQSSENWIGSSMFWQIHLLRLALNLGWYSLIREVAVQMTSNYLWYKCDSIIYQKLSNDEFKLLDFLDLESEMHRPYAPIIKKKDETSRYYIKENRIYFKSKSKDGVPSAKDFIYAVRSYNNSYGLGINFYRPEHEQSQKFQIHEIEKRQLNPDNCLILQDSDYLIGQTLLLTIKLTLKDQTKNPEELKVIADQCLASFLPTGYNIPFNRGGDLFGSPIFEYGIFRQLETYRHILIWFFFDKEAEKKFDICYTEMFDLFSFHAQVIHTYKKKYKQAFASAKNKYAEIETEINELLKISENPGLNKPDLQVFNEQLVKLPRLSLEYANRLRDSEDCANIVLINTRNYTEKLQEIKSLFPHESIDFLEVFAQRSCRYFHEQVTADLNYLHHGFGLIDQAIASIRGQVAIDQVERERNFQVKVFAIGTGLTASGLSATGFSNVKNDNIVNKVPYVSHYPFASSMFYSIVFGLFIGLIMYLLMGRKLK